jgi:hypothetical protein
VSALLQLRHRTDAEVNPTDGSTAQAQLRLSGYALGFADVPPDFGNNIVVIAGSASASDGAASS